MIDDAVYKEIAALPPGAHVIAHYMFGGYARYTVVFKCGKKRLTAKHLSRVIKGPASVRHVIGQPVSVQIEMPKEQQPRREGSRWATK